MNRNTSTLTCTQMHFVMQKLLQKENEDYLNHTVSLQFE